MEACERLCYRIEARTRDGTPRTLYVDTGSGLLRGREAPDEPLVVYDDYRELDGLRVPTPQRRFAPGTGIEERWRIATLERLPVATDVFERPASVSALLEARGPTKR